MVSTSDLQRWQQAITGITAAQNDLSPNEQSAFSALVELYNNGNFEASESSDYIKVLKYSTTKNRLLKKVHLTNFVTLCDKYFKAQAAVPPVPAPVVSPQPVNTPALEPPNAQPPKEVPVPPPTLPPPQQQSYHTVQKTGSSRKGNNSVMIIIGLVIILMLGYIAVKDSDWFNNVISGGDVTTSNEVQLELEIAKLKNQIGEQQTTIDSTVNLIVSLKNQTDEKQAIIDSMVSLIDSLQANNDNLKKITSKYQTGVSPAVISATKLNVLYIGVDNPISISIPGVSSEKISVSMTNGTINKSGNEWIAKPTSSGIATIMTSTNIDGKTITGKMDYRVKVLPTPIAKIGGRAGGVVDKNFLTAQGGVNAELEDFLFDLRYKVTQFSVVAVTTQGERAVSSTSAAFTDGQKAMINGLTKGQKVFVTGIKASGPAGDVDLRDIVFTINQ